MINEIRKGSTVEVEIEDVAFGGRGIARQDGMVLFVEGGLPGDRVVARVTRRKPQYAEATAESRVRESPHRVAPPCPVFYVCGGCRWQDFTYEQQLLAKQSHVADALRQIGKLHAFEMLPIIPSPEIWNYRNKMEFSVGRDSDGGIILGFHKAGDFRTIIETAPVCLIQPPGLAEILTWVTEQFRIEQQREPQFEPYNQSRHTGMLRHFVVRHSKDANQFLMALLTSSKKWMGAEDFARRLREKFPQVAGFTWGTTDTLSDVARMEHEKLHVGARHIEERLGAQKFRVSTFSFFQTNTLGAEKLYEVVKNFAELTGRERVLDAYCGTGTIGIYMADQALEVTGIELVREAVWDARYNARQNGAENCVFLAGEMRDMLPLVTGEGQKSFDRVIVDPPRGGMDKRSLRQLLAIQAPVLIYVSCNPTTLARDAVTLYEAGYRPELVQPVDMFPHTYHVESVVRFRLEGTLGTPIT